VATAFVRRHLLGEVAQDAFLQPAVVNALGNVEFWADP
jgi:hypothetical protein